MGLRTEYLMCATDNSVRSYANSDKIRLSCATTRLEWLSHLLDQPSRACPTRRLLSVIGRIGKGKRAPNLPQARSFTGLST